MAESPSVPVSWGEVIDKITILEIKRRRLRSPLAAADVERELAALAPAMISLEPAPSGLNDLRTALSRVNERLWAIEDAIREKEACHSFDEAFIALARAVYHENDERGRIKQAINRLLRSPLIEHKQYPDY